MPLKDELVPKPRQKLPNVSSEILEKQRFSTASVACGCCSKTAWKNHLPGGKHRASEGRASSEVRNKSQKYYSLARSPLRLPGSADNYTLSCAIMYYHVLSFIQPKTISVWIHVGSTLRGEREKPSWHRQVNALDNLEARRHAICPQTPWRTVAFHSPQKWGNDWDILGHFFLIFFDLVSNP